MPPAIIVVGMRIFALGAVLLSFLLSAQPNRDLGAVRDPALPVHVVAFGDWGYAGDGSGQKAIVASIAKLHAQSPFDLGLTLGDNFYPKGVKSVNDPAWQKFWESDYAPLGIPFFAALGNHDYDGNEQAQVEYTKQSKTWRMPERYYTFRAGPVQFFALDTDEGNAGRILFAKAWSDTQARWLDEALAKSSAPWKIVYGHHPIFSDGHHGGETRLQAKLLPLLKKHKVALYLCGHEHDLQYHWDAGVQFVIAGGGGKDTRKVTRKKAVFAAGRHGFLDLSATENTFKWNIRAAEGAVLHEESLSRGK